MAGRYCFKALRVVITRSSRMSSAGSRFAEFMSFIFLHLLFRERRSGYVPETSFVVLFFALRLVGGGNLALLFALLMLTYSNYIPILLN